MKHSILYFIVLLTFSSIVLSQDATIELPEVKILGAEPTQSVLEHESNQIPISISEVVNMPGTGDDPLRAIYNLPGIVQADGGVYMHGSSSSDNQILVDGISLPYLYHFGDSISLISKDILSSYDVYPSGFGAQYRNRLGGVIDIKLRIPEADVDHTHKLHIGTAEASYFVEGALSDLDTAYFGIRQSYIDLLLTGESTDDVDFTQFPKFTDLVGRWHRQLENGELVTTLLASNDELILNLKEGAVQEDKAILGRFETFQSFISAGTQYNSEINDDWIQQSLIKITTTKGEIKLGEQQAGDPDPGQPYHVDVQTSELQFEPKLNWFIDDDNELLMGLNRVSGNTKVEGYISTPGDEDSDPDKVVTTSEKFLLNEDLDYEVLSFFSSWYRNWNDRLATTIGIRSLDFKLYNKTRSADLSPRLSSSYLINPDLKLTASYGRYYQAAKGFELIESMGNPDLDFQQADHKTLGVHYQFADDWSAQVTVYKKPMRHLVVETDTAERFNNQGSGEARGFDLFVKRKPSKGQLDWISYTYAESERTDHNTGLIRPFDGDQRHTLTWVHQQPMTGSWAKWQWGFKLKMHTGQPYTQVINRQALSLDSTIDCLGSGDTGGCYWSPIYENQNSSRLPDYFNVDISMNKSVKTTQKQYDIKIELLNASELFHSNIAEYDYGDEYENINNPKAISSSFGLLPNVSYTLYF